MAAAKKAAPAKKAVASPQATPAATPPPETPTAAKKGNKTYQVCAPLIAVPVGDQILQYREGDILPDGVKEDTITHLTDLGFIAAV